MRQLAADERGQSTGISNFVIAIVVGAIVTWPLNLFVDHLGPLMKAEANDPVANKAVSWSLEFLGNAPAIFLMTSVFSLLALSVYQRALVG